MKPLNEFTENNLAKIQVTDSGNTGRTFEVNLDEIDTVVYTKFSGDKIVPSMLVSEYVPTRRLSDQDKLFYIHSFYMREFLLSNLANSLGLKTSVEMALIQHKDGSIFLTRAIGDGENRKAESEVVPIEDSDYQIRFNNILNILNIADINVSNKHNVIQVLGTNQESIVKTRNAMIDPTTEPMLKYGSYKLIVERRMPVDENTQKEYFKALQKIVYCYDQNRLEIDKTIKRLDEEWMNSISRTYDIFCESEMDIVKDVVKKAQEDQNSSTSKEDDDMQRFHEVADYILGEESPSQRLEKAINIIREKGKEYNLDPYDKKPDGQYIARRVKPALLNDGVIHHILASFKHSQDNSSIPPLLLDDNISARIHTYCANGAKSSCEDVIFDLNAKTEIKIEKDSFIAEEKTPTDHCTIS